MFYIGKYPVEVNHFPDNSLHLNLPYLPPSYMIEWQYENDAELFTLICIRRFYEGYNMNLMMPYCPHARMDRVQNEEDVFTLKYFCEVINSLNFAAVYVLDPHSNVCTALLDRVVVQTPDDVIQFALQEYKPDSVFFPDEGAMKRYSKLEVLKGIPYSFGVKMRDWNTGKITGYEITGYAPIKDQKILIIDDICSKGGTFKHATNELKRHGAADVALCATHVEPTIFNGEFLYMDSVSHVYTTDSLIRVGHPKIETTDYIYNF